MVEDQIVVLGISICEGQLFDEATSLQQQIKPTRYLFVQQWRGVTTLNGFLYMMNANTSKIPRGFKCIKWYARDKHVIKPRHPKASEGCMDRGVTTLRMVNTCNFKCIKWYALD